MELLATLSENGLNKMCKHENVTTKIQMVNPPKCNPYNMRFSECQDCNMVFATTKQRRKNRKNYNQAYNKYHNQMLETHGIYY